MPFGKWNGLGWFFKSSYLSKFMQQFYQKITLDHSIISQKALILIALANKIVKIHKNWKIALILVAYCQYPCGYDPNLNMANCYVNSIDSHHTLRFGTYPQGKRWADMGSYTTEWIYTAEASHFPHFRRIFKFLQEEQKGQEGATMKYNQHQQNCFLWLYASCFYSENKWVLQSDN